MDPLGKEIADLILKQMEELLGLADDTRYERVVSYLIREGQRARQNVLAEASKQ